MPLVSLNPRIKLFDANGFELGTISLDKAIELDGIDLRLRARGTGRRRRFTSAKLFPRVKLDWIVKNSGGFEVLQLVNKADLKKKRRKNASRHLPQKHSP